MNMPEPEDREPVETPDVPPASPAGDGEDLEANAFAEEAAQDSERETPESGDGEDGADGADGEGDGKPEKPAAEPEKAKDKPAGEPAEEQGPAAKRLAELASKGAEGAGEGDGKPAGEPAAKPKPPVNGDGKPKPAAEAPAAKASGDDRFAALYDSVLKDESLANKKVSYKDPDSGQQVEMSVAEYVKEYPDFAATAVAMAETVAEARIRERIESGDLVDGQQLNAMRAQLINLQFDIQVSKKHPDWREVVNAKEFKAWVETRPKAEKALMTSRKTEDAYAILDAFKEHRDSAVRKAEAAKADQAKAKKRRDDLHGSSLEAAGGRETGLAAASQDADEAFAAEADKLDTRRGR